MTALALALAGCGSHTSALGAMDSTHGHRTTQGDATPAGARRTTPSAARDACQGVTDCRVVTHKDVDGDGRPDAIAWHQLSKNAIQVRVGTASGHLLTARVDVRLWWGGGAWGGAAPVDHRAGVELLVGSQQGAHTPMYTMLTYRAGHLTVENSPSALGPLWLVDAADGDYIGWWRHTLGDGRVAMTEKVASRVGAGQRFSGQNVTYAWTDHAWVQTSSRTVNYPTGKAASVIAGFHVKGLKRFPGM